MVCLACLCSWIVIFVVGYYIARYLWELIPVDGDVRKKAILITGCDSGFGRALALRCARYGFIVFAGCLTDKGAKSLKEEAGEVKGELHTVSLDVTKDDSVQNVKTIVERRLHDGVILWAVVNNAGIFTCYGPDDWCNVADYQLALDVNTLGVVRVTQAFKRLLKRYKGRIVSVASVAGRISTPGGAPYAVSKYGVEAYMDAIRQELYYYDVKCSILEPGIFNATELLNREAMRRRVDTVWKRLSQEERDEWGDEFKEHFVEKWNDTFHSLGSSNINFVVDNYFHALTARFPRLRYRCGYDAIFFYIPISFLPTEVFDALFRLVAKQDVLPKALQHLKKN